MKKFLFAAIAALVLSSCSSTKYANAPKPQPLPVLARSVIYTANNGHTYYIDRRNKAVGEIRPVVTK